MVCRPFQIAVKEPILILLILWLTLIWVIMFTFLGGYKYMFGHLGAIHDSSEGKTALFFAGIALSLLISSATLPMITLRVQYYHHKACQQGYDSVHPES